MISEWSKFKGWAVLEYFLLHPNTEIHVNELARRLGNGTYTAFRFCKLYLAEGMLKAERQGNILLFSLDKEEPRVRALKKFIGPYLVADEKYLRPFLKKNPSTLSIALYGSFANGEYGDHSDLDILILKADEGKIKSDSLSAIELKLGREVNLTALSFAQWRAMARQKKPFFRSIKENHSLVWGNAL